MSAYYSQWTFYIHARWKKLGLMACTAFLIFYFGKAYRLACQTREYSIKSSRTTFPRKIWQISHYGLDDRQESLEDFKELWQRMHPGYQYKCLTEKAEDEFIHRAFYDDDPVRQTYELVKDDPILRADFLRYVLLLAEGGVYTDVDTRPMQPIDVWIPREYASGANVVLGVEIDKGQGPLWNDVPWTVQISQFTIMAKPGHPLLRRVVDEVQESIGSFLDEHGTDGHLPQLFFDDVIGLTGPRIFTGAVLHYLSERTGLALNGNELSGLSKPILITDVLVLPVNGFASGQQHSNSGTALDKDALVSHRWMSSWVPTHPHQASRHSYIS